MQKTKQILDETNGETALKTTLRSAKTAKKTAPKIATQTAPKTTPKTATTTSLPFLKWVGGKRQVLPQLQKLYPKDLAKGGINTYYEPFLGGGAVFFDIVSNFALKTAYLYDTNADLVLTYKVVQQDPKALIKSLEILSKTYQELNAQEQKNMFYALRQEFNQTRTKIDYKSISKPWINRASLLIFLNKTCFNGLFRLNLNGDFNSPQGRYKAPKILDKQAILQASNALNIAIIKQADFSKMLLDLNAPNAHKAFVYFDPPYKPISPTSSFTSYTKDKFNDLNQENLATLFAKLSQMGAKIMLSNSSPKDNFLNNLYKNYTINKIQAKRTINSNHHKRKAIEEIVVTNY